MKLGLVGGSYQERSIDFDNQRCVNFIPVADQGGKEVSALLGTPGLNVFATAGMGVIRGGIKCGNGRVFFVSGNALYELTSDGTATSLGTLNTFTGTCTLAENGQQLAVCDKTDLYIYTFSTPANAATNGTFSADANWTKGSGWTIGAGVATATGAISTALTQDATLVTGRSYVVAFDATRAAGSVTVSIGGTSGTARSSSGSFSETIIAGSSGTITFTGSGFTGTLDNVTVTPSSFEQVTDADLPSPCLSVDFIGGYFVVVKGATGQFFISALYNGFAWDALDFATAESEPDNLVTAINGLDQLILAGEDSTEIWTNTGAADFPFQKISGAKIEKGCAAGDTFKSVNSTLIWVGQDRNGSLELYQATGFTPKPISTPAIAYRLRKQVITASELFADSYQEDGHTFYVLSGGGMETSIVYDLTTGLFHERMYLNDDGGYEPHLMTCFVNAFGKILVGSRLDGKIYEMSSDYYSDNGQEILSERIFQHVSDEGKQFAMNALRLAMETGVGNADDPDPLITMRMSKDGGHNWTDWLEASIGRIGEYGLGVEWRRLGTADQVVFHVRVTSKVKKAIIGAYLS
jgi:hypothetical protein